MRPFLTMVKNCDGFLEELSCWIGFSDNEVSSGELYQDARFSFDNAIGPECQYAGKATDYIRKFKEELTECELFQLNDLFRCWNSGRCKWVKDVVK